MVFRAPAITGCCYSWTSPTSTPGLCRTPLPRPKAVIGAGWQAFQFQGFVKLLIVAADLKKELQVRINL